MVLILNSSKIAAWGWFQILCTTHGSFIFIIFWLSTFSAFIQGSTSGWLVGLIQFDSGCSMTARLSLWEFDKLLKPKAWFMAFKKKISSLRGHVISSISTLYQVKFRVRKFVPSANPPYNQYHSLSGRFISGLYSSSLNCPARTSPQLNNTQCV